MKVNFDNVTFAVSDIDSALDFFIHTLGLKKDRVWDIPHIKTKLVEVKGDDFTIKLMYDERRVARAHEIGKPKEYPLGFAHMVFKVNDIETAYKDLSSRNVKFVTEIIETPDGAKRAFFLGPDNIEFELVQHPSDG
ncbi:VOC family protein [bacterium]|nr:VOC family protein [bacterium]MBU1025548.1 VOC family protein [bacterium]